ncbi:MAG: 1-(5-phosphoribosyl)-5-[(5-phosphoribosylamino)methylideneamino]imidazole-4-carboxamide isomerase [Deltaproteobacteria bacterium]|nr:1-(5-phosphoribosyl)-5-[(5-phosphoribosylamino)methylideneamino]imidazole-4-carboxamide isomerase [Deltaproteobacteria bacterium]
MLVIPAIDLKGGKCVRLKQGRMSEETLYSESPGKTAVAWYQQGAERLHLVDLDGAVGGKPINRHAIREILESVSIPLQLGGGIRNMDTLKAYFDLGVNWAILGTAAVKDPLFLEQACAAFPDRIILSIDATHNRVAVEGWTEPTNVSATALAQAFTGIGISAIVYTDIERDGMSTGPNLKATEHFAGNIRIPVIASGGISGIEDVKKVAALSKVGVIGMITGRALYEGKFNLKEAVEAAKEEI